MQHIVIIGGGLSGLATAYNLQYTARIQNKLLKITLIEKDTRIGGKIWSNHEDGYLCEYGPNGFLTNKPQTLELCERLGIANKLLSSNDNARKRFVVANGKLHKLPHNQLEFLGGSLISWRGKLRILYEFFVAMRSESSDESLADFTRRRLGQEALDKLIAPMASGIFAGNPDTMSLRSCFPRINQLEQQYGGLLRAMLKLAKQQKLSKKNNELSGSPAGPGGVLTSFSNGIQALTNALYDAIGAENILRTSEVTSIEQASSGSWSVICDEQIISADKVILATPAYAASKIVYNLDPILSKNLAQIKYSPLVVACFGYDKKQIKHNVNGFGYLFANNEDSFVLGTLWDSSIFINRATTDKILLRTMLGGAKYPQILDLDDNLIKVRTQGTLYRIMGINTEPEMIKIYRHKMAIPQYNLGHSALIQEIEKLIAQYAGLYIVGNAYYGIGINDCVAAANAVCNKVMN